MRDYQSYAPAGKYRTKVQWVVIKEMHLIDDASFAAHTEEALQWLIDQFSSACLEFGLTIRLIKIKVMDEDVSCAPSIIIGDHTLEVVDKLFPMFFGKLFLNAALNTHISKTLTVTACQAK